MPSNVLVHNEALVDLYKPHHYINPLRPRAEVFNLVAPPLCPWHWTAILQVRKCTQFTQKMALTIRFEA